MSRLATEALSLTKSLHQCGICKTVWRLWRDGTWSIALEEQTPGKCCDNSPDFLHRIVPALPPVAPESAAMPPYPKVRRLSVTEGGSDDDLTHTKKLLDAAMNMLELTQAKLQAAESRASKAEAELQAMRADAGRLEFMVLHPEYRVVKGKSDGKWSAMDCSNGLTFIGRHYQSMREAIDTAIDAAMSQQGAKSEAQ